MQKYCTNMSRADFAGTFPTVPEAKIRKSEKASNLLLSPFIIL